MKFAIYNDSGEIVKMLDTNSIETAELNADGYSLMQVDADVSDDTHYFDDDHQLVAMPPRPSAKHTFDYTTKSWRDPRTVDDLKAEKAIEIERERDARIVAPVVVYDGLNLDADARATENLTKKLTEVNSRISRGSGMPSPMLVWRDHDNVVHQFEDIAAYKDWLDGFAIALGERGTLAYAWSWQKKTALAALTTFDEVEAFDAAA